jgi:hypothetical protein
VAAIKAAQLGLRVRHWAFFFCHSEAEDLRNIDRLRGKAGCSRRNLFKRRMHTLESNVEQLASIPSSPARLCAPRYRWYGFHDFPTIFRNLTAIF